MSCNLQNRWQKFGLVLLVLIVAVNGYAGPRANVKKTALDRYVYKPDPNFKFKLVNTIKSEGHTTYILSLTSQQWRTEAEVDNLSPKIWRISKIACFALSMAKHYQKPRKIKCLNPLSARYRQLKTNGRIITATSTWLIMP